MIPDSRLGRWCLGGAAGLLGLWGPAGCSPHAPKVDPATRDVRSTLSFDQLGPPQGRTEQAEIRHAAGYTVSGVHQDLQLQRIVRAGDLVGERIYGGLVDARAQPLVDEQGQPIVCENADNAGLIQQSSQWFLVQHFECIPGGVGVSALDLGADGTFRLKGTQQVDFSGIGGTTNPCAGGVTPWGTHLGSEEYELDARAVPNVDLEPGNDPYKWRRMATYLGADPKRVDPYQYGWTPEIEITDARGTTRVVKHRSMGRFSHEIALALPDMKTVYLSDDMKGGGGLFLFIADVPGDLSRGRLYAASWRQTGDSRGSYNVSWVDLGIASDAEIASATAGGAVKFADLFDAAPTVDGTCATQEGFRAITTAGVTECLRLRPGMETLASRLETRRFAAWSGATVEFEKGEGLAFDSVSEVVYFATSAAVGPMRAVEGGTAAVADHLREAPNACGMVWALQAPAESSRMSGSELAMTHAEAVLRGQPATDGRSCAADAVANPDNLAFASEVGVLFVGEDSKFRDNANLWAYDVRSKQLSRVLTTPWGGEVTGIQWFPDVARRGYLTVVVQHPFASHVPEGFAVPGDARRSVTAVLGPFEGLRQARRASPP